MGRLVKISVYLPLEVIEELNKAKNSDKGLLKYHNSRNSIITKAVQEFLKKWRL